MPNQTFIVCLRNHPNGLEIDTVIEGFNAAEFAYKHRDMLQADFDFPRAAVPVFLIESAEPTGPVVAAIEDHIRDKGHFGRRAMRAIGNQFDCKIGIASFNRPSITAALG